MKKLARTSGRGNSSDIALIHPPHILHQKKYNIFPLPWNLDHIGSTSFIGRYPVGPSWNIPPAGFSTMKNFVESASGYSARIHNLALLRSQPAAAVAEKFRQLDLADKSILANLAEAGSHRRIAAYISRIKASLFAVDLHWIVYAQGAVETLRLIKELHPHSYTLVGGLSAGYFKEEILRDNSFIDFLIIGDGCRPLLSLIRQIKGKKDFSQVPNLIYRKKTAFGYGPKRLYNDLECCQGDERSPAAFSRGCPLQCSTCGGPRYSTSRRGAGKDRSIYSIESIMRKLFHLASQGQSRQRVSICHDPFLTLGKAKWEALLNEIKRNNLKLNFLIEFFLPHTREDILNIERRIPGSQIHICPETMDENVRAFHKRLRYSNKQLIMNMDLINKSDSLSMSVWFMAGLAKDTKRSVDGTLAFIRGYYKKLRNKKDNLLSYNEMLFIDPGSPAFEDPDKHGFKIIKRSFADYAQSFIMPFFKCQINYETRHFNKDQLFALFLYMHDQMNSIYRQNKLISEEAYQKIRQYNLLLREYEPDYDRAMAVVGSALREKYFKAIGDKFMRKLNS